MAASIVPGGVLVRHSRERTPTNGGPFARLRTVGVWPAAAALLLLAACGAKEPDAADWKIAAGGTERVVPLPAEQPLLPAGAQVMGRPVYAMDERVLLLPVVTASGSSIYRYDLESGRGRWRDGSPESGARQRPLFEHGNLFGSSSALRGQARSPAPLEQPFGASALKITQDETTYSRTWYKVGFPFGQSGWVTEEYGDGRLELSITDGAGGERLLLSQTYRADNVPFTAGWSPDGRYAIVVESLDSASYYRSRTGRDPVLRFAVFGPFDVENTRAEILDALAEADEARRQRQLDRELRQGRITAGERYGAFYYELVERIRSCPALAAVTGPVHALTLQPSRTLALSDGSGESDGLYFTFEVRAERGEGVLQAAAFYPETPEKVRREILSKIVRYDLSFDGEQYFLDDCGAR